MAAADALAEWLIERTRNADPENIEERDLIVSEITAYVTERKVPRDTIAYLWGAMSPRGSGPGQYGVAGSRANHWLYWATEAWKVPANRPRHWKT